MLKYAAIVPHSPLLLDTSRNKFTQTRKAFGAISNDLVNLGISKIISISSHPQFQREGFSAYVHPQYQVQFEDFGDLITSFEIPIWWEAYNSLRSKKEKNYFEWIDEPRIDYGHGIPLLEFNKYLKNFQLEVFAVNDDDGATSSQRAEFGKYLVSVESASPFAIICSGDLATTNKAEMFEAIHQQNLVWRNKIKNHSLLDFHFEGRDNKYPPCINGPLEILSAALSKNFQYEELSYEDTDNTSFLVGRYQLPQ